MLPSRQQGFSLLEILIAFTILAFSLSILLNIFSSGVNSAMVSEEYTTAVQIAESQMAKIGAESKLHNGRNSGVENDKYRWEVDIRPFNFVLGKFKLKSTAELYKVDVMVNWGDDDENDRQVKLSTLKLAIKEQ
jgi:general secretion pathway protein I